MPDQREGTPSASNPNRARDLAVYQWLVIRYRLGVLPQDTGRVKGDREVIAGCLPAMLVANRILHLYRGIRPLRPT